VALNLSLEAALVVDEEYDPPDAPTKAYPLFISEQGVEAMFTLRNQIASEYKFDEGPGTLFATEERRLSFGQVSGMEDYCAGGREVRLGGIVEHLCRPSSAADLAKWASRSSSS